jgi:glucokinase
MQYVQYVIGVDLGGTNLRAVLADSDGQIHSEIRMPTQAKDGPDAVIGRVVDCIAQVRAALPADAQLAGVGVGAPGPLDPFAGLVFNLPNLPGWHNVPLRAILEERTGLPVELGNDANAAALGEWLFGAGKGLQNMVYLTISTGIGGGVIADGRLVIGHLGAATEVGHHVIDWRTHESWEDLASGTGWARRAAQAMRSNPGSALHQITTPERVVAGHVAQAAAHGDPLALQLLDDEGELLGVGLINMLHLFSPALIVLGGGVITNNPKLIDRAKQVVQQRAISQVYREVPIQVAALGDYVGILGAVALFMHMREGRG